MATVRARRHDTARGGGPTDTATTRNARGRPQLNPEVPSLVRYKVIGISSVLGGSSSPWALLAMAIRWQIARGPGGHAHPEPELWASTAADAAAESYNKLSEHGTIMIVFVIIPF